MRDKGTLGICNTRAACGARHIAVSVDDKFPFFLALFCQLFDRQT